MTLRPEPVTSKFRKEYFDQIYPIRITRQGSLESFGKSTESLVSILYRNSELNTNHDNNEIDSIFSDLDTDDFIFFDEYKPKRSSNKKIVPNGINREKININNNSPTVNLDKKCKRIIARQPDYPGSRTMEVKYGISSKINVSSKSNRRINPEKKTVTNLGNGTGITRRKVVRCSQNNDKIDDETLSYTASSNFDESISTENSLSKKVSQKPKSQTKSSQQESSRSNQDTVDDNQEELKSDATLNSNHINKSQSESGQSQRRIQSASSSSTNQIDPSHRKPRKHQKRRPKSASGIPRNAWEKWFMEKEKLRRIKEEERRQKEAKEDEEKAKLAEEKRRKKDKCQEKITEWLQKKDERRLKLAAEKQSEEEKKRSEQAKKDEIQKKSKEKFDKWNQKKLEAKQKEEEKKQKEREDEEALKMIKKTKAEVAYKEWLKENRKFQPPVPYSYGISDGKLTSYYDKTSNPPPSFFNPNPWVSNRE